MAGANSRSLQLDGESTNAPISYSHVRALVPTANQYAYSHVYKTRTKRNTETPPISVAFRKEIIHMARIRIELEMPELDSPSSQLPAPKSPEEQIKEALECIESGHDSREEWLFVNSTYSQLCKMKPTPRVKNLIDMIKPVMAKHGYFDVATNARQ